MLRGWLGYFKHAHSSTFRKLDGFIRRRLRALLRKKEKRPGFGRCLADQKCWPNVFFADAELFALHTAWQTARHPRLGNYRLESRVRENRTHGSAGGEGASPSRPDKDHSVLSPCSVWCSGLWTAFESRSKLAAIVAMS
jgi:group II intron maturase